MTIKKNQIEDYISDTTQTALDGKLDSVVWGTNITIDNTDPNNPVINSTWSAPVDSVNGQTWVVVLDKTDIWLGNVDNTSDATKTVASTNALESTTTTVNVSSATAPTTWQVLTATSTTAATWQTPSSGWFWTSTSWNLHPSTITDNVGISQTAPLASLHVGNRNVNDSSDAEILISQVASWSWNYHAYADSSSIDKTWTIGANSYDAIPSIIWTNNYDHYVSFQARPQYSSTWTITDLNALSSVPSISAGTATNVRGIDIYNAWWAGTVTNQIGVRIQNLTKGVNNFAIVTDWSTPSEFGWNVEIKGNLTTKFEINTQTGTTYTLALTDTTSIVEMNNASANTITIPTNASVAFPIWTTITVIQIGAWLTTVTGAGWVTVNGVGAWSKATAAVYEWLALYKRGTNEWVIINK